MATLTDVAKPYFFPMLGVGDAVTCGAMVKGCKTTDHVHEIGLVLPRRRDP